MEMGHLKATEGLSVRDKIWATLGEAAGKNGESLSRGQ
jgi:hypothetical protein